MLSKIQKWGNSQRLCFSKNLLIDAHISVDDEVEIAVKNGIIIVSPAKRKRGHHNLKDLVERIPKNYQTKEIDCGEPMGIEVW